MTQYSVETAKLDVDSTNFRGYSLQKELLLENKNMYKLSCEKILLSFLAYRYKMET